MLNRTGPAAGAGNRSLPPNTQLKWVRVCWAIAAGALIMAVIPMLGLVDIFSGGGAMLFIGLWLAVSAVVVSFLFRARARAHDHIVGAMPELVRSGDGSTAAISGNLAHWTYDAMPWREHAERDFSEERSGKWALWRLIATFCLVIGGGFLIADRSEAGLVVAVVLVGLLIVLAIVVVLSTSAVRRHNLGGPGEVFIGRDGVWNNGGLHVWRGWGGRLEEVDYPGKNGNLVITYSTPARYGRQYQEVRLPVPDGREAEAADIASELRSLIP